VSHISPELASFLNAGDPPIAFTAGTAMVHGKEFFATSIAAAKQIGRRAILLTRHPEQLPASLPGGVFHADYAPFGEFLPRCALLVHHGGVGTTGQALKAGIPHLIHPLAHDQFDNANRLKRLGVGDSLKPSKYTVDSAAQMLNHLLTDSSVRDAVQKAKSRFDGLHPLEETCDEIEAVMAQKTPVSS
jgi:rhamnosyltransferase subunit B